jgi:hypothetical protein
MAYLPTLPEKATLLDVFRMFPETNRPLLEFHEVLLRGPLAVHRSRTGAHRRVRVRTERLPVLPRRAH